MKRVETHKALPRAGVGAATRGGERNSLGDAEVDVRAEDRGTLTCSRAEAPIVADCSLFFTGVLIPSCILSLTNVPPVWRFGNKQAASSE